MNIKNKIIMKTTAILCAMSTISLASIPAIANPRNQSDGEILNHNNLNFQELNPTLDLHEFEEQQNEIENKKKPKNKARDKFKKQNSDSSDLKMLGQKRSKPADDDEISLSSSEQSSNEPQQQIPQSQLIRKNPIIPFLKQAKDHFSNNPIVTRYNEKCKKINQAIKKANSNFSLDPNEYKELTEKSKELSLEFDLYTNFKNYERFLLKIQKEQKCWKSTFEDTINLKSDKKIEKIYLIKQLINNSKQMLKNSDNPKKISFLKSTAVERIKMFSELFEKITDIEDDKVEKIKDSIQKFKDIVVNFKHVLKEFKKTKNEFEYTTEIKDGLEKLKNISSKFQSIMPIIDRFNVFSFNYHNGTFNDAVEAFNNLTDKIENIPEIQKTTVEIENIIDKVKNTTNKSENTINLKDKTIEEIENMIKKMTSVKETIKNVIKIKDAKQIFQNINEKSEELLNHTNEIYDEYIYRCDLFPVVMGLLGKSDVPNNELLNCKNMLTARENIEPINQLLSSDCDLAKKYLKYDYNIYNFSWPMNDKINIIQNDPKIMKQFIQKIKENPDFVNKLITDFTSKMEKIKVKNANLSEKILELYNKLLDIREDVDKVMDEDCSAKRPFKPKQLKTTERIFKKNYSSYFELQSNARCKIMNIKNQKIKNYNLPDEIKKRNTIEEDVIGENLDDENWNKENVNKKKSKNKTLPVVFIYDTSEDESSDLSGNVKMDLE